MKRERELRKKKKKKRTQHAYTHGPYIHAHMLLAVCRIGVVPVVIHASCLRDSEEYRDEEKRKEDRKFV